MFNKAPYDYLLMAVSALALLCSCMNDQQMETAHSGPVMNYHRVNDQLVTGGHLMDGGTAVLKKQGVKVVIDLRDDSPPGEKERFAEQGIEWINIPVKWRSPEQVDFDRFSDTMRRHQGDHILVQCEANYRASTMTYLYRVLVEGVSEEIARKDLSAVWNPIESDTWSAFIDNVKSAHDVTEVYIRD